MEKRVTLGLRSRNVLAHQIENRTYHKTLLNQTKPNQLRRDPPGRNTGPAPAGGEGRVYVRLPGAFNRAFGTGTGAGAHGLRGRISARDGRDVRFCRQPAQAINRRARLLPGSAVPPPPAAGAPSSWRAAGSSARRRV